MIHPAFVHPRPVAILHRFKPETVFEHQNEAFAFHRVVEPATAHIPHIAVQRR